MKPKLLDLFCGAGGATRGYQLAGFEVWGVDLEPQPHYCGDHFTQSDVFELEPWFLSAFDAVHASPPCQAYAGLSAKDGRHPRLIEPTRELLRSLGVPYVIENIEGAPLLEPVKLCGSMFALNVRRHRLFESNVVLLVPQCAHSLQAEIRGYYGRNYGRALFSKDAIQRRGRKPLFRGTIAEAFADMEIDWMPEWDEIRNSIPPVYTQVIGYQLLAQLAA